MHLLDHLILPHSSWIPFSGFCFSFISLRFSLHCFKFRGSFLFVLPLLMNFLKIFIIVSVFLISGIYIRFFSYSFHLSSEITIDLVCCLPFFIRPFTY